MAVDSDARPLYTRIMKKIILTTLLSIALVASFGASAFAAKPTSSGKTKTPLGIDVSWPQCGTTLPDDQAFAIVGVNGGLANNTNPCFAEQFAWAQNSLGGTNQPLVSVYVNTGNPGLLSASWPTSNAYVGISTTNQGYVIDNPYGTCDGTETAACAYIYGWSRAYDDVNERGVPNPATLKWWLDVETGNSWSETDLAANAADLEGMTDYLQSIGAQVGVYSTGSQWKEIVGTVSTTSNLNGLDSWLAGARTVRGAEQNCSNPPLTPTSKVVLTQFVSNNLDYNYSCI